MLNAQVAALAPPERKPDLILISEIDRIRKRRNDLMHRGSFDISRVEVYGMDEIRDTLPRTHCQDRCKR
jgi:hypothetical protein